MTSTQISYFLAVVKYKTFTLAAEELYISQSSLSKQIKALEEELGCVLFLRENKENTLTDAGKIFFEYAENFAQEHFNLTKHLNELSLHSTKKPITIGVLPVIYEYNIGHDLALFQTLIASSNVYFNLLENTQAKLVNDLHSGKVDAIIVRTDNLDLNTYKHVKITEENLVVVFPKCFTELIGQEKISLNTLINYPLISFENSSDLFQTIQRIFKCKGRIPRFSYLFQRHEQILSMINAEFGVAILPEYLVNTSAYSNISTAPLETDYKTSTSLVTLKNKPISKELELLFQYFESTNKSD